MRIVRVVGFTTLALIATVPGQAFGQTEVDQGPGVLRQLTFGTNPSRTFEWPGLAIHPRRSQTMALSSVEFSSGQCRTHVTTDAGRTWNEAASPQEMGYSDCGITNHNFYPVQSDTSLTYGEDGTLYYAFAAAREDDNVARSILLGRSTDNGRSWQTTVVRRGEPAEDPKKAEVNVYPSVAASSQSGQVFVAWRQVPNRETKKPAQMVIASSSDGGRTFGPPSELGPGKGPEVVTGPNATFAFFSANAKDYGGPGGAEPAAENDELDVVVMARSTDGGRSWNSRVLFTAEAVNPPNAVANPQDGTLSLTWADNRLAAEDEVRKQVFVSRSTDTGRTWSDPVAVAPNEPEKPRENVNQLYPEVSLAPNGRVDVAWYDYRNDPFPIPKDADSGYLGEVNDVFVASSTDGGRSFGQGRRVNRTPIDRRIGTWNSQYFLLANPGLVSTDEGYATVWSDTENGRPDIQAPQDIFYAASPGIVTAADEESGLAFDWQDWLLAAELFAAGLGLALLVAWGTVRRRRRVAST